MINPVATAHSTIFTTLILKETPGPIQAVKKKKRRRRKLPSKNQ